MTNTMPGQSSDEKQVARVARGDQTAFGTLYDHHASAVFGLALRITGERTIAEDVVQETFWRLWQSATSYQPERGTFRSWFFRIARTLAIEVRPQVIPTQVEGAEPILDQVPDIHISDEAQANVVNRQIRAALKMLSQEQRQTIELAYFYGRTRQEIAAIIGEPLETTLTNARLGLQKLGEDLNRIDLEF